MKADLTIIPVKDRIGLGVFRIQKFYIITRNPRTKTFSYPLGIIIIIIIRRIGCRESITPVDHGEDRREVYRKY